MGLRFKAGSGALFLSSFRVARSGGGGVSFGFRGEFRVEGLGLSAADASRCVLFLLVLSVWMCVLVLALAGTLSGFVWVSTGFLCGFHGFEHGLQKLQKTLSPSALNQHPVVPKPHTPNNKALNPKNPTTRLSPKPSNPRALTPSQSKDLNSKTLKL